MLWDFMWEFIKTVLASSGIILFVVVLWVGAQEFTRRYKKNHPESNIDRKKEISECMSCDKKKIENRK